MTVSNRIRALFREPVVDDDQEYERLQTNPTEDDDSLDTGKPEETPFSSLEYTVFVLLGMVMLWAWNMYLAAAPYFAKRFASDGWILSHFQSSILTVGTVMNLLSNLVLAKLQAKASYPKRIGLALLINIIAFALLSVSTTFFRNISAGGYLGFLLTMVFCTSLATGLCQNGAFALAAGFGHPSYMQGIMTGQGIAGVLPAMAQIISVLAVPPPRPHLESDAPAPPPPHESSTSALIYFLTAAVVCIITFLAFIPLVRRHNRLVEANMMESVTSVEEAERARRKVVGLLTLFKKLHWLALAIFICFAVTMFYPVFTAQIISNNASPGKGSRILQPSSFIPLAFLLWNLGDLLGRMLSILPFSLTRRPLLLFAFSVARLIFLPLYLLCNIGGRGAAIPSDAFYLIVVQLGFGLTNGWLGSSCMMVAIDWVDDGEKEAAGAFMGVALVAGLSAGSLLSFTASSI
ncbi:MAG: hypothetical protein M1818_003712 [Claussenomyces sp. TS43310]|nr:MAG: hypothetical protein M1818_003712 [Claussenomyces sp. TS43310]